MSTKIYNGLIFDVQIQDLLPILNQIRNKIEPIAEKKIMEASYSLMIDLAFKKTTKESVDSIFPKDFPQRKRDSFLKEIKNWDDYSFFGYLLAVEWAKYNEKTDFSFGVLEAANVSLELSLFPYRDRTLAIPFGANDLIDALKNTTTVRDYCYWNNSDKLESVSDEEWDERGIAWDVVLPTGLPVKDGFSYTIMSSFLMDSHVVEKESFMEYFKKCRDTKIRIASREAMIQGFSHKGLSPVKALEKVAQMVKSNDPEWQKLYRLLDGNLPKNLDELLWAVTQK